MVTSDGKQAVGAKPELWRVGKRVPINVYEGDRPVCQCHSSMDAQEIVAAMNAAQAEVSMSEGKRETATSDGKQAVGAKVEEIVKKHGLWNPIYNRDDAGVLTTKAAIVLALEEAYDAGAAHVAPRSAAPYIKAVNEELANLREWANLEARRADKAEAQLAEGHSAAEPQLEKAEAKLRELGIVREGDEYVFDGKE